MNGYNWVPRDLFAVVSEVGMMVVEALDMQREKLCI